MASLRFAVSIGVLLLALGGAGALAVWAIPDTGATDRFSIEVLGADSALLRDTVHVRDATVLRALEVACKRHGLALDLERFPGMGTYVRAIGGERASGANGWVYEINRDGTWINGDRSAELFPLETGDAVRWTWT